MEKVSLKINGVEFFVEKGLSILKAAEAAGVYIPRLCSHPDLTAAQGLKPAETVYRGSIRYKNDEPNFLQEYKGCQLCVVKIKGEEQPVTSCNHIINENLSIWTDTSKITDFRKERLKNILSQHRHACLTCTQQEGCNREPCSMNIPVEERCCPEFGKCELRKVAEYIEIKEDTPRYIYQQTPILEDEPIFIRDYELCIGCTRCIRVCKDIRGVEALGYVFSNGEVVVGSKTPTLKESGCKFCCACVEVCPTGALSYKDLLWGKRESILNLKISSVTLPPEKWIEFTEENVITVPETEGAIQLLDENKQIILIQGTPNLLQTLKDQLNTNIKVRYFGFDEDPMYTKKESELLQQFMQRFGRMPEGNEELDNELF